MTMNSNTRYESFDIYVCAFLLASGARLEGIEREGGRVRFLVSSETGLKDLLDGYWSNQPISTVPSALFASLKHLKGLIHSGSSR